MSDLGRLHARPWTDRWLLLQAVAWLAVMRAAVSLVPFRRAVKLLRLAQGEIAPAPDAALAKDAARIGWAVAAAAARSPWTSTCLTESLAGMVMLRRRGIGSTLHLAVAKGVNATEDLSAHAWLRCGDAVLIGAAGRERFAVISTFAAPARSSSFSAPVRTRRPADPTARAASTAVSDRQEPGEEIIALLVDCLHLDASRVSRERLASLSRDEWQSLLNLAGRQRVSGLLRQRLRSRGLDAAVPEAALVALCDAYRRTSALTLGFYADLQSIAAALQARDVPVIALKGAHLAGAVYGDLGLREMNDLDLLVPAAKLGPAAEALEGLGYRPVCPYRISTKETPYHSRHLPRFLKREAASVEIHWNICWPDLNSSFDASELWRRAVPIRLPSGEALGLCAEDLFLHLCLHASRQHQFEFGLRPLCDIGQVVRCYGDRFAWPQMVERARRWKCTRDVYLGLRLARDLLGAEVPDEILQDLRPVVFDETLIMTARRQVFSDSEASDSVPAPFAEFWDDRSMAGRARKALGIIFRPKEILLEQYALPADSRRVYLYYAVRLKDLLSRHGRFALNLLRRQPQMVAAVRRKAILREWLAGERVHTQDDAPRLLRRRQ